MYEKSKKLISAEKMESLQGAFRCPICKSRIQLVDQKSLVCRNRHCFDIAKRGYINLSSRSITTKYDKDIFHNRRFIIQSGLFNPLHAAVSEMMMSQFQGDEPINILDAGCGEGSHLNAIEAIIKEKKLNPVQAVGIDISKEGISYAAAEYTNAVWCVADLANCPFTNQQFNFVINILSPANYSEFGRLLKNQGLVVKCP